MANNVLSKFVHKVKDKLKNNQIEEDEANEYIFNTKDLDELNKDNIEKIKELKKDILKPNKKEEILENVSLNETILNKENSETIEEVEIDEDKEEPKEKKNSFINLEKEHQELIMNKWKNIDITEIEKDILEAKDLLHHNYTITYADDAARFVHNIRKKYEVVLCYLIGFNNEKKGIPEKTFFSDHIDNEWKYLNYYIKILEKIKNFKVN